MGQLIDANGKEFQRPSGSYVIIFDLDGTLADHSGRLKHLTADNSGWDKYFAHIEEDEVVVAGAVIFNLLATQCRQLGHLIKEKKLEAETPFVDILTGRPEKYRAQTLEWLVRQGFLMPRAIHMRPEGDFRQDAVLKIEMYEQIYKDKETVLAVFEDRERCVKAWRAAGVPCFQVCDGSF